MSDLVGYRRRVEALGGGECPPEFASPGEAISALVDEICSAAWNTPEERDEAQVLVYRLELVRDCLTPDRSSQAG